MTTPPMDDDEREFPWLRQGLSDTEFAFACGFHAGRQSLSKENLEELQSAFEDASEDTQPFIRAALEALGMVWWLDPLADLLRFQGEMQGYPDEEVRKFEDAFRKHEKKR